MSTARILVAGAVSLLALTAGFLARAGGEPLPFDGPWAFVANSQGDSISVIYLPSRVAYRTLTLTCPSGIGSRCEPFGLALNPRADRLYVSNSAADSVTVVDPANLTAVATWSLRRDGTVRTPRELAVSPDGRLLYVSNQAAGTVSILATDDGRVVAEPQVGTGPRGLGFLPDGRVVVANRESDTLTLLDPTTHQVITAATLEPGSRPVAVQVVGDPINRIYVLEQATNRVESFTFDLRPAPDIPGPIPVGAGPVAIVYDPRVQRLYVACGSDNSIWRIDLPQSSVQFTVFGPTQPNRFNSMAVYPGPSPGEALLVVTGADNQTFRNNLVGFVKVSDPTNPASAQAGDGPWGVVVFTRPASPAPPPTPTPTPGSGPSPSARPCPAPGWVCLYLPILSR